MSVEKLDHSRQNLKNLRNYGIQNDSGKHSDAFHSIDEDLETQFEKIKFEERRWRFNASEKAVGE